MPHLRPGDRAPPPLPLPRVAPDPRRAARTLRQREPPPPIDRRTRIDHGWTTRDHPRRHPGRRPPTPRHLRYPGRRLHHRRSRPLPRPSHRPRDRQRPDVPALLDQTPRRGERHRIPHHRGTGSWSPASCDNANGTPPTATSATPTTSRPPRSAPPSPGPP